MARRKAADLAHIAAPLQKLAVPIADLNEDPANVRTHDEKNLASIRESLEAFGQRKPIVVRADGMVVTAGNGTLAAARLLGWPYLAAVVLDDDETTAQRYAIADNRTAELAEWDDAGLAAMLEDLRENDALEGVGFDSDELDALLGSLVTVKEHERKSGGGDDPPELDERTEPITKRGDIWLLDGSRLMCGDSTKDEDVDRLTDGMRPHVVVTDPPFAIYGSSTGIGSDVADDKMVRPFFEAVFRQCHRVMPYYAHLYMHTDWRSWAAMWEAAKSSGFSPKNMLVWDKGNFGMGSSWGNAHELIYFATKLRPQRVMKSGASVSSQRVLPPSNILRYPRASGDEREHNASKPIALEQQIIEAGSDEGQVVLDLFTGGGAMLIAAIRSGRLFVGMEIEPRWCDVIVKRWENETGKTATKA